MMAQHLRRSGALLVSAAVLASLTLATVAAPATAAKPTCAGKTATIVGTAKGEVIKGTKKADVIVAKGGHDRIYGLGGNDTICGGAGNDRIVGAAGNDLLFGQTGRDKLFGGAGRDRLLGGPANDRLAGGPGNDACLQGSGLGLRVGCERPVPKLIAIAYSDLDGNHSFGPGDVLISKLVDTDGNGPDVGDQVVMGRYPVTLDPITPEEGFDEWVVKSHTVTKVFTVDSQRAYVQTGANEYHQWLDTPREDSFDERIGGTVSSFVDSRTIDQFNFIELHPVTPSRPVEFGQYGATNTNDDRFVDVEIYP